MAIINHPNFLTNFPARLYNKVQAYIIANDVPIALSRAAYDDTDNPVPGYAAMLSTDGKQQDLSKFWRWYDSIAYKNVTSSK